MDKNVITTLDKAILNAIAEVINSRFFDDRNELVFDSSIAKKSELNFIKAKENVPAIYYVGENSLDVVEAGRWGDLLPEGCAQELLSSFRLYIDFQLRTVDLSCGASDSDFTYTEEEMMNAGVSLVKIINKLRDAYEYYVRSQLESDMDFPLKGKNSEEHAAAIICPDY